MDERENVGYIITDTVCVGETEFVLGVRNSTPPCYVTWACKNGNDYFWGHYFDDLLEATEDLLARAKEETEFLRMCRQRQQERGELER